MSDNSSNTGQSKLTKTIIITVIVITTLVTLFFWLIFFQWISAPSFLKFTNLSDAVTLTNPDKITDPYVLYTIGELVKDGTLMSIDELWSFQSSFYQTIVTFLIAINGLIGALAFVFIKSSSNDKAQEAAVMHSKTYIESADFKERVNREVQERIKGVQDDYQNAQTEIWEAKTTIHQRNEEIEFLLREQQEIKRHISIISKAVAKSDNQDENGGDLIIKGNGNQN
ncbi:hypothetical protein [Aliivibrio fischeri]|uniref:Uncharacterized protein n=1 Tax=Aliivibrio fischeri TaxID=668 RepID=A0A510UN74_ALIFS|nr:hypothetical protein [Aliivibrio fischeri]GEK14295.1 hypothetical protein AFI02nite_23310 [Aliivibrio fischeri]